VRVGECVLEGARATPTKIVPSPRWPSRAPARRRAVGLLAHDHVARGNADVVEEDLTLIERRWPILSSGLPRDTPGRSSGTIATPATLEAEARSIVQNSAATVAIVPFEPTRPSGRESPTPRLFARNGSWRAVRVAEMGLSKASVSLPMVGLGGPPAAMSWLPGPQNRSISSGRPRELRKEAMEARDAETDRESGVPPARVLR